MHRSFLSRYLARVLATVVVLALGTLVYSATTRVERVIDGDTFVIESGDRVRMIGVNAPEESDILGPRSTRRLKELIERKQVSLLSDGISSDRDRYGRLLRYVEIDGEDINLRMLEEGQVTAYLKFKFSRSSEYRAAQEKAMKKSVGMWGQAEVQAYHEAAQEHPKGLSSKGIVIIGLILVLLFILIWSQFRR